MCRCVQSPVGVALGATVGHLLATGLAIAGGALLSNYISERVVSDVATAELALW